MTPLYPGYFLPLASFGNLAKVILKTHYSCISLGSSSHLVILLAYKIIDPKFLNRP
jgi:hypothetical protein